jgi:beta-galactosidase
VTVNDANGEDFVEGVPVTFGKEMHTGDFGTGTYVFTSNGSDPVRLVFRDSAGEKGVWLNGFSLSRWFSE